MPYWKNTNTVSGNPTSYYNGSRWTMDWENGRDLVSANNGTQTVSYTYTADGLRTGKTVGDTAHTYIYAGGKLLRETYGNTTLDFFYDTTGTPYALKVNGTVYYYITNLQGDVVYLVDSEGATVASYDYDPYGRILSQSGDLAAVNPLRYRGYYYDTETGFYYLSSRYYDPEIARFINADGYASTGQGILGHNMLAYCNNNPVNSIDPGGNMLWGSNTVYYSDGNRGVSEPPPSQTSIRYDVPLYWQGNYDLCWAACLAMAEDFRNGVCRNEREGTARTIEIAMERFGPTDWDQPSSPDNLVRIRIVTSRQLFAALKHYGPLYVAYSPTGDSSKKGKEVGHAVLVTGFDLATNTVYTNNPWKVYGEQSFEDFINSLAGDSTSSWQVSAIYYFKWD